MELEVFTRHEEEDEQTWTTISVNEMPLFRFTKTSRIPVYAQLMNAERMHEFLTPRSRESLKWKNQRTEFWRDRMFNTIDHFLSDARILTVRVEAPVLAQNVQLIQPLVNLEKYYRHQLNRYQNLIENRVNLYDRNLMEQRTRDVLNIYVPLEETYDKIFFIMEGLGALAGTFCIYDDDRNGSLKAEIIEQMLQLFNWYCRFRRLHMSLSHIHSILKVFCQQNRKNFPLFLQDMRLEIEPKTPAVFRPPPLRFDNIIVPFTSYNRTSVYSIVIGIIMPHRNRLSDTERERLRLAHDPVTHDRTEEQYQVILDDYLQGFLTDLQNWLTQTNAFINESIENLNTIHFHFDTVLDSNQINEGMKDQLRGYLENSNMEFRYNRIQVSMNELSSWTALYSELAQVYTGIDAHQLQNILRELFIFDERLSALELLYRCDAGVMQALVTIPELNQ